MPRLYLLFKRALNTLDPDLPELALSVRQPWAWAIVAGHKRIENRTAGAIRTGAMVPGPICIHAATGLKQDEFSWGHWRLQEHGVTCPRPQDLPRGAIIGHVQVTDIITQSDSPWFGGPMGLVLANPVAIDPIPAQGALGYFRWSPGGLLASAPRWMQRYGSPDGDQGTGDLFDDLPVQFRNRPTRPHRR